MKHRAVIFSAGVVAGGLAVGLWLSPSRRIAPDRPQAEHAERTDRASAVAETALPEPPYLPQAARALLHRRMARHGDDLGRLAMRVALRDAAGAKTLAERIAAEPGFARPVSGDATELNSALPPAFFTAQDALRQHARTLAETAARGEVEPLTAALVPLVQTCQGCHALYLKGPPGPEGATPATPPPPPPPPT